MANDSAEDINVGVALSTALLLPGDLERNAELSEYENYALMLQYSVQAIQHVHFFSVQSFENWQKLVDMKRDFSSLQKTNKGLQSKMKKLEDQAEAAIKAQTNAEEKAEAAEAIRKVAESQKREAKEKMVQAEKELQEALATKEAEIKDADEKAYTQGMADVTDAYEQQVKEACNKDVRKPAKDFRQSYVLSKDLKKLLDLPVHKRKDDQVLDLTHEEDEEVIKETTPEQASSDVPQIGKSVDETLAEIDAEIAADEEAEVSLQETSEVQIQPDANADAEKS
ncbi:uncharacterized protein LOC114315029 [Camellia sinensis]|uniref:uncharacterized protein LOC114315029 n=1 Tax=Camellia sinensis TaxID=4442 RepID=UPI001035EDC2|nr:uncharacterized protein LOC114315029 [Camellia sinensis]